MSIYMPKSSVSTLKHVSRTIAVNASRNMARGMATQVQVEGSKTTEKEQKPVLNWPQYLAIRRSRHRWQTAAMVPSGLLGFSSGVAYFASIETHPPHIFGFDPFLVHGFLTVACLGIGVLIGPTLGGALWRWTHRRQVDLIDEKDREFLERIAKNRVDPSLQTATAPVPDYYGERIGSLHQYRQWLRDQNKYRRKVLLPEKEED